MPNSTPRTDRPFTVMAEGAPSPIHEGQVEGPYYNFVYFFEDGGVSRLHTKQPDTILMQQAYMVMVSIPRKHNQAPYVEIIKSRHGAASLVLATSLTERNERS